MNQSLMVAAPMPQKTLRSRHNSLIFPTSIVCFSHFLEAGFQSIASGAGVDILRYTYSLIF
jgi:hypothetical protein